MREEPEPRGFTPEDHRQRHIQLHTAFDELSADYIRQHPAKRMSNTTLMELLEWSHSQTLSPTEPR